MKRIVLFLIAFGIGAIAVGGYLRMQPADAETSSASSTPGASSHARGNGSGGGGSGGRQGGGNFPTAVTVGTVERQTIPITDAAVGYVEAPNVVVLRTRVDGVVLQQNVTEGQMVKAGDVLFKLDDTTQQAAIARDQAAVSKDQAAVDEAQKDLLRDQTLAKEQAGTQQALDQQEATFKAEQGTLAMDQAQLKADQVTLGYMTITAPISGRVGAINTSVGNVVRAADTSTGGLLTITQMSPLDVRFAVPERNLDRYRNAMGGQTPASVSVRSPGDSTPRAGAALSFIDSSVDQSSGTVNVKASVSSGAANLWPGQYVNVVTLLGAYTNAITVPLVAVQQDNSGSYVFAVQSNNTVKKLPVTVETTTSDVAVLSNSTLNPGDKVVTEGQLRLNDGSPVSTSEAKTAAAQPSTGAPAPSAPAAPTSSSAPVSASGPLASGTPS